MYADGLYEPEGRTFMRPFRLFVMTCRQCSRYYQYRRCSIYGRIFWRQCELLMRLTIDDHGAIAGSVVASRFVDRVQFSLVITQLGRVLLRP